MIVLSVPFNSSFEYIRQIYIRKLGIKRIPKKIMHLENNDGWVTLAILVSITMHIK